MLEQLSRAQLARLTREYMLAAHFNSRTGYAALQINHGEAAYKPVAIDNWMACSPIYTQRMQQAMKLRGDSDVETIFKGMQLEVGLAHQYFDARFEMTGPEQGEFWLNSCGPLLEVEPRGDDAVRVMCHDIEDPTFDATAVATNSRARIRPIHRPPRQAAGSGPHCRWRVFIDHDAKPLSETEITARMRTTRLAQLPLQRPPNGEAGGQDYYDGDLVQQMQLERFSQSALAVICREVAVQIHLLIDSLWWSIADRYGESAADAVTAFQMEGAGWMMSERLMQWLGCEGDGVDALEQVLAIHPAFQPQDYYRMQVSRLDENKLRIALLDSPAAAQTTPRGWYRVLQNDTDTVAGGNGSALAGLVRGVNRRACVTAVEDGWVVEIAESAEAAEDPFSVQIARGSVLYRTQLEDHVQLLEVTG
jgi:hypothetical protein